MYTLYSFVHTTFSVNVNKFSRLTLTTHAGRALTEALDKSKKKYQSKIKKMEQQMLSLMSSSQMKKLMIPSTNSNNL